MPSSEKIGEMRRKLRRRRVAYHPKQDSRSISFIRGLSKCMGPATSPAECLHQEQFPGQSDTRMRAPTAVWLIKFQSWTSDKGWTRLGWMGVAKISGKRGLGWSLEATNLMTTFVVVSGVKQEYELVTGTEDIQKKWKKDDSQVEGLEKIWRKLM